MSQQERAAQARTAMERAIEAQAKYPDDPHYCQTMMNGALAAAKSARNCKELFSVDGKDPGFPPGFSVTPVRSDLSPGAPYTGCKVPVSYSSVALLLHWDEAMGLQQGLVQTHSVCTREQYQEQFDQFLHNPNEVFDEEAAATLVVHSARPYDGEAGSEYSQLHPLSEDRKDILCMHHAEVPEAVELVTKLSQPEAPSLPETMDTHDPCQLVAWALYLMDLFPAEELNKRLVAWRDSLDEEKKRNIPEPAQLNKSFRDVRLQNHKLLNKLTRIQLSLVQGWRRLRIFVYVMFDMPELIQLDEHIGTPEERDSVRKILDKQHYEVQVFALPKEESVSTLFSVKDIVRCKDVGVARQQRLHKAREMSLWDKMLHHSKREGLFEPSNPWQTGAQSGGDYLLKRFKIAADQVFPSLVDKTKFQKVKKGTGIRGNMKTSVNLLLENHLRQLPTVTERKKFVRENVPPSYLPCLQRSLARSKFADWATYEGKKSPLMRHTRMEQCCNVAAYFALLFSHSHVLHDGVERHVRAWQADYIANHKPRDLAGRDDPREMVAFAMMLILNYYLPARALLSWLEKVDEKTSQGKRCQWIKPIREAALYSQLGRIHSANLGRSNGSLGIAELCYHLDTMISGGRVAVSIPSSTLECSQKENTADLGTRYFPKCVLTDFYLQFHVAEHSDKPVGLLKVACTEQRPPWLRVLLEQSWRLLHLRPCFIEAIKHSPSADPRSKGAAAILRSANASGADPSPTAVVEAAQRVTVGNPLLHDNSPPSAAPSNETQSVLSGTKPPPTAAAEAAPNAPAGVPLRGDQASSPSTAAPSNHACPAPSQVTPPFLNQATSVAQDENSKQEDRKPAARDSTSPVRPNALFAHAQTGQSCNSYDDGNHDDGEDKEGFGYSMAELEGGGNGLANLFRASLEIEQKASIMVGAVETVQEGKSDDDFPVGGVTIDDNDDDNNNVDDGVPAEDAAGDDINGPPASNPSDTVADSTGLGDAAIPPSDNAGSANGEDVDVENTANDTAAENVSNNSNNNNDDAPAEGAPVVRIDQGPANNPGDNVGDRLRARNSNMPRFRFPPECFGRNTFGKPRRRKPSGRRSSGGSAFPQPDGEGGDTTETLSDSDDEDGAEGGDTTELLSDSNDEDGADTQVGTGAGPPAQEDDAAAAAAAATGNVPAEAADMANVPANDAATTSTSTPGAAMASGLTTSTVDPITMGAHSLADSENERKRQRESSETVENERKRRRESIQELQGVELDQTDANVLNLIWEKIDGRSEGLRRVVQYAFGRGNMDEVREVIDLYRAHDT